MENLKSNQFITIIKGALFSIIATLIFLFIYSIILTYTNVSENTINVVIMFITGISILIGSSLATRKIKKMGLVNGGIIGAIYILILYLISSIINSQFTLETNSIIMIVVGIIAGIIGGIVGVNIK